MSIRIKKEENNVKNSIIILWEWDKKINFASNKRIICQ